MITKEEAARLWTSQDKLVYGVAEQLIDNQIKSAADDTRITVNLRTAGVSVRVKEKLIANYRAGGWNVGWVDGDQRDPGPYMTLS